MTSWFGIAAFPLGVLLTSLWGIPGVAQWGTRHQGTNIGEEDRLLAWSGGDSFGLDAHYVM